MVLFYSLLLTWRGWSKRKSEAGGGGGRVGDAHIDRQGKTTLDPARLEH